MRKVYWSVLIFMGLVAGIFHLMLAQHAVRQNSVANTTETLLNGEDWRLGLFEMNEGEKRGAFGPGFDDRSFRRVRVPGEGQLQIGLRGMALYYQSSALSMVNEQEWGYRKHFTVSKSEAGKVVRLMFDGVDYFGSVWLNGE